MKQLEHNLWTDGENQYKGNPKDGFTKITKKDKKPVEASAFELKQPSVVKESKIEVDTEPKE
jgi:hypothetical protein